MSWAVIYTHSKQEDRVVKNLTRQGFLAWVPKIKVTKRHRSRFESKQEVMFPNYVFVNLQPKQIWAPINSTYGARYLLCHGHNPQFLPESFINSLLDEWKTVKNDEFTPQTPYKRGDEVKVVRGPFAGMVSKIIDLLSKERVQLLFEVLGQSVPTILPKKLTIRNG